MRIDTLQPNDGHNNQIKADLENLIQQPGEKDKRPCDGCVVSCKCSQSTSCTCGCSAQCENAPKYLTSDPEKYPIEPLIVPLVYAFKTTGICTPCWSCEGHLDQKGELWRLPQVWFYSRSVFYPRIIAEYLLDLQIRKEISHNWQVNIISPTPHSMDVTFSLVPHIPVGSTTSLGSLQQDAQVIARNLATSIKQKAQTYLQRMV